MSQYAARHTNPAGAGDSRPTAIEIISGEKLNGKLKDKTFFITGVSSGIGIETMRALYATGGHVYGTVRDMKKGEAVKKEIEETFKKDGGEGEEGKITLLEMNMDDLSSVKSGAETFLKESKELNVLICNAGVMATPYTLTKDNFESQFAICHLAHFALFHHLLTRLLSSATPAFPSRVVVVSSYGHRSGQPRFTDYHFTEPDSYNPWAAYGQAKTANIWFSNEIERRYAHLNLHSTSLHPGGIATGLGAHLGMEAVYEVPEVKAYMKSPAQGAATSVYCAVGAEWADKGGKYLSDCQPAEAFKGGEVMGVGDDGYAEWAYDDEKAGRLWGDSVEMVGVAGG